MEDLREAVLRVWSEEEQVKGSPLTPERRAWLATQVVLKQLNGDGVAT